MLAIKKNNTRNKTHKMVLARRTVEKFFDELTNDEIEELYDAINFPITDSEEKFIDQITKIQGDFIEHKYFIMTIFI